jgi:hypothetical protein
MTLDGSTLRQILKCKLHSAVLGQILRQGFVAHGDKFQGFNESAGS